MKRFLILFIILGLIAGSATTAGAKKKPTRFERTVERTYDTQFVPFGGLVTHTCDQETTVGCVAIKTSSKEAYLTAKVEDAHAQPVLVNFGSWDPDMELFAHYGSFCGETKRPIRFPPGVELTFWIGYWDPGLPSNWATCPPGFGTTGTISVTLSNLP